MSSQMIHQPALQNTPEAKNEEQCTSIESLKVTQYTHSGIDRPTRPKTFAPSNIGRFSLSYVTNTGAWQAYIQCPSWLSQSVLELQSNPTLWSSNYSFRVYNIVSYDSDVVQMVRKGDKNGVLQLFSSRKASPFDKDQYGSSLLYVRPPCQNRGSKMISNLTNKY